MCSYHFPSTWDINHHCFTLYHFKVSFTWLHPHWTHTQSQSDFLISEPLHMPVSLAGMTCSPSLPMSRIFPSRLTQPRFPLTQVSLPRAPNLGKCSCVCSPLHPNILFITSYYQFLLLDLSFLDGRAHCLFVFTSFIEYQAQRKLSKSVCCVCQQMRWVNVLTHLLKENLTLYKYHLGSHELVSHFKNKRK